MRVPGCIVRPILGLNDLLRSMSTKVLFAVFVWVVVEKCLKYLNTLPSFVGEEKKLFFRHLGRTYGRTVRELSNFKLTSLGTPSLRRSMSCILSFRNPNHNPIDNRVSWSITSHLVVANNKGLVGRRAFAECVYPLSFLMRRWFPAQVEVASSLRWLVHGQRLVRLRTCWDLGRIEATFGAWTCRQNHRLPWNYHGTPSNPTHQIIHTDLL